MGRPSERFVPPKSPEQLTIQAVHRIRQRPIANRTRLVNQTRGLLAGHGPVMARGPGSVRQGLKAIADGHVTGLSALLPELVHDIRDELTELDRRISTYDKRISDICRSNAFCQRIGQIEGIGPITATALAAAIGDRTCFGNGRAFAAWPGLVPRQGSSGGRARLLGISKRGDRYLRTLMIHGARAGLGRVGDKGDPRSLWLRRMRDRRHPNVVAVALANKNARVVWAMLVDGTNYRGGQGMPAA